MMNRSPRTSTRKASTQSSYDAADASPSTTGTRTARASLTDQVDQVDQVIEKNNTGASYYFDKQDYTNAFQCFRQALVLFKTRVKENQNRIDQSHTSTSTSTRKNGGNSIRPRSCSSVCMALGHEDVSSFTSPFNGSTFNLQAEQKLKNGLQHQHHQQQGGEQALATSDSSIASSCFAVHTQCFRFLPGSNSRSTFSTDPSSSCDERTVSAVLVFNCALVFHLQGQATCSYGHLQKAVSLYQQAASLLEDEIRKAEFLASSAPCIESTYSGGTTTNSLVSLLCMAVLNNMGLILRCDLLEREQSRRCFDQLVSFAHAFDLESSTHHHQENDYDDDEVESHSRLVLAAKVENFLLNAVALRCLAQTGTAAA
jgi:tetratricopeptide (TPR) repeat protein